jgi:hypothetical protein
LLPTASATVRTEYLPVAAEVGRAREMVEKVRLEGRRAFGDLDIP